MEHVGSYNPKKKKSLMKQMWAKSVGVNYDGNESDEILGKITNRMVCSWKFTVEECMLVRECLQYDLKLNQGNSS